MRRKRENWLKQFLSIFFYVFKMAEAIVFLCKNALEAQFIFFVFSVHISLCSKNILIFVAILEYFNFDLEEILVKNHILNIKVKIF